MNLAANSRYQGVAETKFTRADGVEVAYLKQRFVPDPTGFSVLSEHAVADGDRLDNIAWILLGDAELAWRVADANRAMRPGSLTEVVGRRLVITLPAAMGGLPRV